MERMECARCGAHTFDTRCGNCWSMHLRPVVGFEMRPPVDALPPTGRFARPTAPVIRVSAH
jgi:hypothetical protein